MKKKAKKAKAGKKKVIRKKSKKVVRKATRKKTVTESKKTGTRKGKQRKGGTKSAAAKKAPTINGTLIGHVTHYFPHVDAAVVKIENGGLAVGDTLYFKGHTTDFKQSVNSMQMDRAPIQKAGPGDEIGVEVKSRVREHDEVYKMR